MDLTSNVFFPAESAAGFLTTDAHFFQWQAGGFSNLPAVVKGDLRPDIKVKSAIFLGNGNGTFRLHEEVLHERR